MVIMMFNASIGLMRTDLCRSSTGVGDHAHWFVTVRLWHTYLLRPNSDVELKHGGGCIDSIYSA